MVAAWKGDTLKQSCFAQPLKFLDVHEPASDQYEVLRTEFGRAGVSNKPNTLYNPEFRPLRRRLKHVRLRDLSRSLWGTAAARSRDFAAELEFLTHIMGIAPSIPGKKRR
jgi:hypothetical protein